MSHFQHAGEIWRDYPGLHPAVILVSGVTATAPVRERVAAHQAVARTRLAGAAEGELPEVQAWRRAFATMGLKPTQYRCASESLLRRFRKEGSLPEIHPLIDICNAASLSSAIPVAVFDLSAVTGDLEVGYATGDETYLTFGGETQSPEPGEVIFADAAGRAHARRWTNRQSGHSAVRESTTTALIVAEALHPSAADDIARLAAALVDEVGAIWSVEPEAAVLSASAPRFTF